LLLILVRLQQFPNIPPHLGTLIHELIFIVSRLSYVYGNDQGGMSSLVTPFGKKTSDTPADTDRVDLHPDPFDILAFGMDTFGGVDRFENPTGYLHGVCVTSGSMNHTSVHSIRFSDHELIPTISGDIHPDTDNAGVRFPCLRLIYPIYRDDSGRYGTWEAGIHAGLNEWGVSTERGNYFINPLLIYEVTAP
jgi:hypothetical protein